MINGKQCTIIFHVDDMKISHPDPEVVTNILNWLKELYQTLPNGEVAKIKDQRGKKREYLGMDFDFITKKEVKITMVYYIKKLIKDFHSSSKRAIYCLALYCLILPYLALSCLVLLSCLSFSYLILSCLAEARRPSDIN